MRHRSVNKAIPKVDAWDLARGARLFSDDIRLERAITLKVKRSERCHARLVSVDVSGALKVPGVIGVLTHQDVPAELLYGIINKDQPVLAKDKVRFLGEAIAIVGAEDEEAALAALDRIHVEYEDLPAVFDPEEALRTNAPAIHDSGNLLHRRVIRKGDIEKALAHSAVVVKRTYSTSHLEHTYLEPDAGAGYIDEAGRYVIYASTQNPHYDQADVSRILGVDKDRIRIVQSATGGGFGSKLDLNVQHYIALALHHFRRPAKLVYSREEAYLATAKRHPLKMEMETGADRHGRITGLRARIICDTGAYASYG
ncbi:MAG: aldehyde oxidase, partial [Thermoplasmata archaeon]